MGRTLELSAHMKVRAGQLEGFRKQASEIIRIARDNDTRTLRYDWFLNSDGTECEVREAYSSPDGLIEHRANVGDALNTLFAEYADDHRMTVYGEASQQLRDLADAHHMTERVTSFSFFEGLDTPSVRTTST
jgi:quinol monooxygenase YgiN